MITFLMILYVIVALLLVLFILIQPGKGDMGLGSMSNQMMFGGSGGQNFFEKTTWTLGAIFIFGALGLALLKTKEVSESQLKGFKVNKPAAAAPLFPPTTNKQPGTGAPITTATQQSSKLAELPLSTGDDHETTDAHATEDEHDHTEA